MNQTLSSNEPNIVLKQYRFTANFFFSLWHDAACAVQLWSRGFTSIYCHPWIAWVIWKTLGETHFCSPGSGCLEVDTGYNVTIVDTITVDSTHSGQLTRMIGQSGLMPGSGYATVREWHHASVVAYFSGISSITHATAISRMQQYNHACNSTITHATAQSRIQ